MLQALGIDELDWCALAGPGISTVAQPVGDIGRRAVERVLYRIENGPDEAVDQRFAAVLHARGPTGAIA